MSKRTGSTPQHNSFISPAFSNIVHPSVEFDTAQWLGPFKTIINTKGLVHSQPNGEQIPGDVYDEQSDVLMTLETMANYGIPSGSIIELGSTNDLKARSSRIDSITVGSLYASTLDSPEDIPRLASIDDGEVSEDLPVVDCGDALNQMVGLKGKDNKPLFENLLNNDVLYISPQIAAQLSYTPTEYSHIPLDQLVCNNNTHSCGHPVQFAKTQTDFAQHKCGTEFNEDNLLSLALPLEKHIFIRIAALPRVPPQSSQQIENKAVVEHIVPSSLRIEQPHNELRVAQNGVFYLLPSLNNFPKNVIHDILIRYLSTPLRHQNNPHSRGRQLHVGCVFAVPITIQEEDRLYHQSIEEKAEDHDEENMASVPGAYFPVECLYFFCAQLECDKNTYTATDQTGAKLYEDEEMAANFGHHNNFLTCHLTRVVTPSIQDARALVGLQTLKNNKNEERAHQFVTTENIDVHRSTSYMIVDPVTTEFTVHAFNLTCLRPSLFQHLYQTQVTGQNNYSTLTHLAIKHALLSSPANSTVKDSVMNLLRQYPTILFNIPILDTLLLRGYGPAFTALMNAILPTFYSLHSFVMPLLQSTHTKNSKATLLRALSYMLHLDYLEMDTDQAEGLIPEGDIQFVTNAMSAVVNIRNIGVDTVIPPLPARQPGIVNNIFVVTASCADTPKHILATDVVNVPLPSPTPRTRMYLYELLTRMNFNLNNTKVNNEVAKIILNNDISCKQLSAMMVCSYVGLTGYTNAPTQSVSLLAQAILVKSINTFKSDKELFITALQKKQDSLLTCHCTVLGQLLQHNNVASGIPNVSWKDIGAAGTIRKELMQLIKPKTGASSNDTLSAAFSLQRRGVLLYGPPGSGKTLVAKALAGESGIGFVTANAGEILSMYIGESEKKIRDLFINARNSAPCVLFLDEIDSLAPSKNNSGNSGGGGVMQRIVSQLLLEIDALNDDGIDVFLVGATNRPELLDLSLLRPGRLDRSIYVGISNTVDDQLQILKALTRKFTISDKVNLRKIIEAYCHGRPLTGADFFALASTSMTLAIMDAVNNVEREKNGEVIDVDADDYDVEDDPDPIVHKVPISAQVGSLDSFSRSSVLDKTLSVANLGLPTIGGANNNTNTGVVGAVGEDMSTMGSGIGSGTFGSGSDPFTSGPRRNKKVNLYNIGKDEKTTGTSNVAPVEVAAAVAAVAAVPGLEGIGAVVAPTKKKKKKGGDGILDFGFGAITAQPEPVASSAVESTTSPAAQQDAKVDDKKDSDAVDTPVPVVEATTPVIPPTKKKKKKNQGDGILDFGFGAITAQPEPVVTETPVVEATTTETTTTTTTTTTSTEAAPVEEIITSVTEINEDKKEEEVTPVVVEGTTETPTVVVEEITEAVTVVVDQPAVEEQTPVVQESADPTPVVQEATEPAPAKKTRKSKKGGDGILDFGFPMPSTEPISPQTAAPAAPVNPSASLMGDFGAIGAIDGLGAIVAPKAANKGKKGKSIKSNADGMDLLNIPGISFTTLTPTPEQPKATVEVLEDVKVEEAQVEEEKKQEEQEQPQEQQETPSTEEEPKPSSPVSFEVVDEAPEATSTGPTLQKPPSGGINKKMLGLNTQSLLKKAKLLGAKTTPKPTPVTTPVEETSSTVVEEAKEEVREGEKKDVTGNKSKKNALVLSSKLLKSAHLLKKVTKAVNKVPEPEPEPELEEDEDFDEDGEQDEDYQDEDYQDEDGEEDGEEDEWDDEGDEFIPAPAYGGVQMQLLFGQENNTVSSKKDKKDKKDLLNVIGDEEGAVADAAEPFKFADDSDESDVDYDSDDEFGQVNGDDDDNDWEEFFDEYDDNKSGNDEYDSYESQQRELENILFLNQQSLLQQDRDEMEAQKREEVSKSVALRGVVVYQKHFIQAAKKLTPSLSKDELDHYAKIREQFSSKRSKKAAAV